MSDPFPGKLREYCLRGPEHLSRPAPHVWAANVESATTRYKALGWPLKGVHVSSVRTMAEETEETLRDA